MPEITLEQNHALLVKLADYMMSEFRDLKGDVSSLKQDVSSLKQEVNILKVEMVTVKTELAALNTKVDKNHQEVLDKIDGLTAQFTRLDTEKHAMHRTLDFHETRLGNLEEHVLGNRIRENSEGNSYNKK